MCVHVSLLPFDRLQKQVRRANKTKEFVQRAHAMYGKERERDREYTTYTI